MVQMDDLMVNHEEKRHIHHVQINKMANTLILNQIQMFVIIIWNGSICKILPCCSPYFKAMYFLLLMEFWKELISYLLNKKYD